MTQHQIGFDVCKECSEETLLNHLQNAFKVDNETHERVLEETRNLEVIVFTITFCRRHGIILSHIYEEFVARV